MLKKEKTANINSKKLPQCHQMLYELRRYLFVVCSIAVLLIAREYFDVKPLAVGIDFGSTQSCVSSYDAKTDRKNILFCTKSWITKEFFETGILNKQDGLFDEICGENISKCFSSPKFFLSKTTDSKNEETLIKSLSEINIDSKSLEMIILRLFQYLILKSNENIPHKNIFKMKQKIKDAVISTPADYSLNKRNYLAKIAAKSGVNVLGVISEPTAAALGYGLHVQDSNKGSVFQERILVYDFGGGTVDVSYTVKQDNMFTTIAMSGNNDLGGEKFTLCLSNIIEKHQNFSDLNFASENHLLQYAESLKINLSSNLQLNGLNEIFEARCSKLFDKIIEPVKNLLSNMEIDASKLDSILLTGGASQMPKVKQILRQYFPSSVKIYSDNVITAVAEGNAIYANVLHDGSPLRYSAMDLPGIKKISE